MPAKYEVDPDTWLTEAPPRQLGVSVPSPLYERVDELITLVRPEGQIPSRAEMVAALLYGAPEKADELADMLVDFKKAKARDAAIKSEGESGVLRVISGTAHKPGRRAHADDANGDDTGPVSS